MTIQDPVGVAARAMHQIDCGCEGFANDNDEYYLMLARAAAPILIQQGRELAARDLERVGETVSIESLAFGYYAAAHCARGGES